MTPIPTEPHSDRPLTILTRKYRDTLIEQSVTLIKQSITLIEQSVLYLLRTMHSCLINILKYYLRAFKCENFPGNNPRPPIIPFSSTYPLLKFHSQS